MKFVLGTLLMAISIVTFSQEMKEMRSPKFKCSENESKAEYYVLVGNAFPQIPDLDYSTQLQLVESKYYYDGTASMEDIFTIKNITDNHFETEVLDLKMEGIDLGKISLKMTNDGKLKQTFVMSEVNAQIMGVSERNVVTKFTCEKF